MPDLISISECARRLGVSPPAVSQALARGRITHESVDPKSGRKLLDFEKVLRQWHRNTDPAMQPRPEGGNGRLKPGAKVVVGGDALYPDRDARQYGAPGGRLKTGGEPGLRDDDDLPEPPVDGEDIPAYNTSRAKREYYAAQNEKLKHDEAAGLLVNAEQVKNEAFALARKVRDAIMSVPDRIDAELAAETNPRKVSLKLKAELIKALEELDKRGSSPDAS